MALVVITRKAYGDEPGTDYPNLAGKAKNRGSYQGIAFTGCGKTPSASMIGKGTSFHSCRKSHRINLALASEEPLTDPDDFFCSLFSDAVSADKSISASAAARHKLLSR
jgi:hypothetical protein